MNLRETILAEHSRTNCTRIVNWVGNKQQRLDELVQLVLTDRSPLVRQRGAWPMSDIGLKHPELFNKHMDPLVKLLKKPGLHTAIPRAILRMMEKTALPEKLHGEIMDTCFNFIMDPAEKPAVKAFSLGVMQRLLKIYPEILQELKIIIEERWDSESAAFKSRAKKIVKRDL
jgi:hypothetical protein